MIKIGMCDDNLNNINLAKSYLESEIMEQDLDAEITIVTTSQKEIFDKIYTKDLDILFLDIDFKNNGKNGIEFAKDLREINKDFYLIFLSAHQRYIQISFITKVFDFLVKPINRETIADLVSRIKDEFEFNKSVFLHLNKWKYVKTDDILFIEKFKNKSIVYTYDEQLTTTKNLSTLINELSMFCKIKCINVPNLAH